MLDGLTRDQFDEWLAYRTIEPDPLDRLFAILRLGFSAVCNAWGAKIEPKHIDPYLEKELAGGAGTTAAEEMSPNQGAAMVRATVGAGR